MKSVDVVASAQKKDMALEILGKGVAMVHCDPMHAGVSLPGYLCEDPVVRLNFAYGFQLPSFDVDGEGISAVLNFNGDRFHCVIPWAAVFAITAPEFGHEGRFWPGSAPSDVLDSFAELGEGFSETGDDEEYPIEDAVERPTLRVIDGDGEGAPAPEASDDEQGDEAPEKKPRPPFLSVVK
jgi:stringent starvation protein B